MANMWYICNLLQINNNLVNNYNDFVAIARSHIFYKVRIASKNKKSTEFLYFIFSKAIKMTRVRIFGNPGLSMHNLAPGGNVQFHNMCFLLAALQCESFFKLYNLQSRLQLYNMWYLLFQHSRLSFSQCVAPTWQ